MASPMSGARSRMRWRRRCGRSTLKRSHLKYSSFLGVAAHGIEALTSRLRASLDGRCGVVNRGNASAVLKSFRAVLFLVLPLGGYFG
eukprot:3419446-Pyramimonas_sp.AAC.2